MTETEAELREYYAKAAEAMKAQDSLQQRIELAITDWWIYDSGEIALPAGSLAKLANRIMQELPK